MPDDYAVAAASPRSVEIGGVRYLVGKFTPRDLGDLGAYLKEVTPDPRLSAREVMRDLPDAVAKDVWSHYCEEARGWPPTPLDAEGNRILTQTTEGAARVLWVLLRRHQPIVDLERARGLVEHVGFGDLIALIEMGFPEPTFDPKSPARAETTGAVPA